MSLNAGKILGINVTLDSRETILEEVEKYLLQSPNPNTQSPIKIIKSLVIVTPNPEQVVYAQHDLYFKALLNKADVALPDGIGISLAAKFLKSQPPNLNDQRMLKRIAGVEFMEELVALAAKRGCRIGLIGGRVGLALQALECLQKKYQGLEGWAEEGPHIKIQSTNLQIYPAEPDLASPDKSTNNSQKEIDTQQYFQELAYRIEKTKAQMIFVGLGAPKQEYFIEKLCFALGTRHSVLILMSVGGSFDIISGKIQRAPLLVRSIGFEWMWRLILEPWRVRRQLALVKFVFLVCYKKLASKGQAFRG